MKEPTPLLPINDHILDLAFEYKKEKLWKKLRENQIFAIKDPAGGIDYCSVLGHAGEHCALVVYPGQSGLDSYRTLLNEPFLQTNEFAYREALLCQDCISLSLDNKEFLHPRMVPVVKAYCKKTGKVLRGKNAYPDFGRNRPAFQPWHITEKSEADTIELALEAALEVVRQLKTAKPQDLGFIENVDPGRIIPLLVKDKSGRFQWQQTILPNPAKADAPKAVLDDISASRLKRKRKNHCVWGIHIFLHNESFSDESVPQIDGMAHHAPFFPYVLIVINEKTGMIANWAMSEEPGIDSKAFSRTLIDAIDSLGRPDVFYCIDDRTADFMSDFSKKLGIKVFRKDTDPYIESALDEFAAMFGDDEDVPEDFDDMMEGLFLALSDPEMVAQLPDDLLLAVQPVMNELPVEMQNNLKREIRRRRSKKY